MNVTRDQLALGHHRWHCTHEVDPVTCVADQQDYDFADFVTETIEEES